MPGDRSDHPVESFLKLKRSPETLELLKDPNAFALLTVIALRARRTQAFNVHRLRLGQALVGDYRNYGLSLQEYRGAKARLQKWSLARFRSTNRGTIATLLGTRIYDINEVSGPPADNTPPAGEPPVLDHPPTTNKNEKKEKREKKEKGSLTSPLRSPMTFEEMDRARATEALAQAGRRFLADGQD
jgi:hypothetical protein